MTDKALQTDMALQTARALLEAAVCECGHESEDHWHVTGTYRSEAPHQLARFLMTPAKCFHCECQEFRPVRFTVRRADPNERTPQEKLDNLKESVERFGRVVKGDASEMAAPNDWRTDEAPEGIVVDTKIDDSKGVRNEQPLKRQGNLWFYPDGWMYVYYTPTHWRFTVAREKGDQ